MTMKKGNKKEVTVSVETLIKSSDPVREMLSQKIKKARLAYNLGSVARMVDIELVPFNEAKNKLIESYGNDGTIDPESKDWEKFQSELNKLMFEEVSLNVPVITVSQIEDANIEVTGLDMLLLDWFLEE